MSANSPRPGAPHMFFGWQVVSAAFVVALFGWGVGFYGPPVFLHAVQGSRGWPVSLVAAAVTCHFLVGAAMVANLAGLHRRFGLVRVTRAAAVLTGLGFVGWALAREPWQLFAATILTGAGWGGTGAAAINAMVSPWFIRRRPAALGAAFNGASVGGVILSPLWVALIGTLGFAAATALVGGLMVLVLWWLSGRYFGVTPSSLGLLPDGDVGPDGTSMSPLPAKASAEALPGAALWRSRVFVTLAAATSLSLFAQIGLIAHLYSLLAPALGTEGAGLAGGLATACAIAGRSAMARLLKPRTSRRKAAAANYALQACGSLVLLFAGGTDTSWLLSGVVLFGLGLGNATSLPPLIAQADFAPADTARAVSLVTACSQAAFAFAPLAFGLLREYDAGLLPAPGSCTPGPFAAAALLQAAAAVVVVLGDI